MSKLTGLISVFTVLAVAGVSHAQSLGPLQNGTFQSDLAGWTVSPAPDPEVEAEYVIWDEDSGAALLLPYGAHEGLATTYTGLSQQFNIPQNYVQLCFDVTMNTLRPGFETDVLSVILNADTTLYELTSSQVNEAALSNQPQVTSKYIDQQGLLQHALYKTTVSVNVAAYMDSNVNLVFQLKNDNTDGCISSVYIDNIQVLPDTTPPVISAGTVMELWPPNHKYHTFELADCISATDNSVDGLMDVNLRGRIISIYSDEPEDSAIGNGNNGDGSTLDDMVIVDDHTVKLRAERHGGGNGRVYGITVEVSDLSGNSSTEVFYVGTPHDQGGSTTPVDDGPASGYVIPN